MTLLLAHQGGWDELLWFLVPVALVVFWVRWAEKRSRDRRSETEEGATSIPGDKDA